MNLIEKKMKTKHAEVLEI